MKIHSYKFVPCRWFLIGIEDTENFYYVNGGKKPAF